MPGPDDAPRGQPDDLDVVALIDVLDLIAPGAIVHGWERLDSGTTDLPVHRVDLTMPSGAETSFVLRQFGPGDGDLALRVAATLEGLRSTPVRAAELLWVDSDGAVFGRAALATTYVTAAGGGSGDRTPVALAEALVALQWVPADAVAHLPRLPTPADLVAWWSAPADSDDVAGWWEILATAAGDIAPLTPVLVHGALGEETVRMSGSEVAGFVDWRRAVVGDPRSDVAALALTLTLRDGTEVGDAFVAAYEALRGPTADRWWFDLLAAATQGHTLVARATTAGRGDEAADRLAAWVERALAGRPGPGASPT